MRVPTCIVCGCTNAKACVDHRGPCWWVAPDRCSHCPAPAPDPIAVVVCTAIRRRLGLRVHEVLPSHHLIRDLACDSMDHIEIARSVQDTFDIQVSDDEGADCATVADWIALVERKLGGAAA